MPLLGRRKTKALWYTLDPPRPGATPPAQEGPYTRACIVAMLARGDLGHGKLIWTNERIFPNPANPKSARPVRLLEWRRLDQIPDPVLRHLELEARLHIAASHGADPPFSAASAADAHQPDPHLLPDLHDRNLAQSISTPPPPPPPVPSTPHDYAHLAPLPPSQFAPHPMSHPHAHMSPLPDNPAATLSAFDGYAPALPPPGPPPPHYAHQVQARAVAPPATPQQRPALAPHLVASPALALSPDPAGLSLPHSHSHSHSHSHPHSHSPPAGGHATHYGGLGHYGGGTMPPVATSHMAHSPQQQQHHHHQHHHQQQRHPHPHQYPHHHQQPPPGPPPGHYGPPPPQQPPLPPSHQFSMPQHHHAPQQTPEHCRPPFGYPGTGGGDGGAFGGPPALPAPPLGGPGFVGAGPLQVHDGYASRQRPGGPYDGYHA